MSADFLWDPGTNGYIATPFTVLTTELNALSSASLSTLGGAYSASNTGGAMWGEIIFTSGGTFTPSSGLIPLIWGWFIRSSDGGSTYEFSGTVPPRSYDFAIPLPATALASGNKFWCTGQRVMLPSGTFKTIVQSQLGATMPATGNTVSIAPMAMKYVA